MNDEILLGKNNWKFWYYRYKDSPYYSLTFIVLAILVCAVLIFQVIIPQLQSWFSIRDEVLATQERINIMRNNTNFMNNVDRSVLNNQMQIAFQALPQEKNFDAILTAISDSALRAGVSVGDYSFLVGEVASVSGQSADPTQHGYSSVEITLNLASGVDGTKRFLKEVREKLPLSEVVQVEGNQQISTVTLRFYQKPFPNISFNKAEPIVPVSDANRQLLQQLSSWQANPLPQDLVTPSGSASGAVPLF